MMLYKTFEHFYSDLAPVIQILDYTGVMILPTQETRQYIKLDS